MFAWTVNRGEGRAWVTKEYIVSVQFKDRMYT